MDRLQFFQNDRFVLIATNTNQKTKRSFITIIFLSEKTNK